MHLLIETLPSNMLCCYVHPILILVLLNLGFLLYMVPLLYFGNHNHGVSKKIISKKFY